ncbi:Purine catabolism regulatory protein-like family protein [Streptomyces sp. SceaMP-e96]|uniref:PucR family transcriptional regulator n=1 Tax=unclassified Streptomyces TaxID=2593676 RepID=UPI000823F55E|nr:MULTISPECIES: PucR family transcriptional regulator [unclassified Streptomyces]MYT13182.1 PucR family transcriptional regulator [Streptomyces sp. SID4951]SCK48316.1 Purine catabolism regulatory protein-like family protein [Streptomyces sp. SceaMP-e96]
MPHPMPPPSTPPVPLADLLARTDLGLRQIAGPRQGVAIHWVHTSEMADPVPYLLGGEMLLTAGVHLAEVMGGAEGAGGVRPAEPGKADAARAPGALDAYLDGYAARTVAAGAAALGFGIAPVHDTVPAALVAACDRHGLPLVEVPAGTPFTAVESAVWQAVTEARHRELTRLSEAQRALAAAAARPDPASAVLRTLARHVHGWTALLAPDGAQHGSAGPRPATAVRTAAARLAQVIGAGGPSSATDTLPGTSLSAYALTGRGRDRQALALVVAADPHDPPAHAIAGVAAVLLSLITGPATAHGPATAEHSAALVRLLLGARPADVAPLLGPSLWTVVHAERRRDTTESAASLAAALGTSLVAPGAATELPSAPGKRPGSEVPGTRRPGSEAAAPTEAGAEATTAPGATPALRALIPADREITAHPGWTLGVSEPAPVAELPAADRHAASALRRALAGRTALVRHRTPGPHSVTSLVAPTDARRHAQALLAPLTDSPHLLTTLHNWLALHGSWDRTATALGIHRNTVRQRITRIAGLLDTDLDDPDVRMELWFALRSLDRDATQS